MLFFTNQQSHFGQFGHAKAHLTQEGDLNQNQNHPQVRSGYIANQRIFLKKHLLVQSNNRNIRKRCEICSKLTIKTPERRQ